MWCREREGLTVRNVCSLASSWLLMSLVFYWTGGDLMPQVPLGRVWFCPTAWAPPWQQGAMERLMKTKVDQKIAKSLHSRSSLSFFPAAVCQSFKESVRPNRKASSKSVKLYGIGRCFSFTPTKAGDRLGCFSARSNMLEDLRKSFCELVQRVTNSSLCSTPLLPRPLLYHTGEK